MSRGAAARWRSRGLGLLVLPLFSLTAWTFGEVAAEAWNSGGGWRKGPGAWFLGGCGVFLVGFAATRGRGWREVYLFAHEWTHALAALGCGVRVLQWPRLTPEGGHVVTSETNAFISLAPYLVPLPVLLVLGAKALGRMCGLEGRGVELVWFALIGLAWAFHVVFTVRLAWQGQPDLERNGVFLSTVVVLAVNLGWCVLLFLEAEPGRTGRGFAQRWWDNGGKAAEVVGRWIGATRGKHGSGGQSGGKDGVEQDPGEVGTGFDGRGRVFLGRDVAPEG